MAYSKLLICFGLTALTAGVLIGCKKKSQPSPAEPNNAGQQQTAEPNKTSAAATAKPVEVLKPTLREIIAKRKGWAPAFTEWVGKEAPDFTVSDLNGKSHKLSEYRGRNVMLIFWATWCRPCISEIPHLIELRDTFGEDKLAMLAISYISPIDPTDKVRKFVAANPAINYTVISTDAMNLPRPYNLVESIPSSFFIDPEGRIKFATEGAISIKQMKEIIEAQR